MPVASVGFMLRPDGFFDRNPALDLPPPATERRLEHRQAAAALVPMTV